MLRDPSNCLSMVMFLSFSCSDFRSLVDRVRVGEVGIDDDRTMAGAGEIAGGDKACCDCAAVYMDAAEDEAVGVAAPELSQGGEMRTSGEAGFR